nr:hypothetical protein GCM10020093_016270 [Planobispora longispora]
MDRVSEAARTERAFAPPEGFDATAHVARSLSAVPYRHEVRVLLETTLEQARRRIPAEAAALSEEPGGVLLTARAERLDGMAQMLAGLGWPFTILEPDGLRAEVRDLAARLAGYADDPGGR